LSSNDGDELDRRVTGAGPEAKNHARPWFSRCATIIPPAEPGGSAMRCGPGASL
jgi:hypothetical protein